jgi:5-formyltetrahydrofolate cyclo-ligase
MRASGNEHLSKAEWRDRILRARAAMTAAEHAEEATALASVAVSVAAPTVCAYVPFGTEPGSIELLNALVSTGSRVLLPVIPDVVGPLEWAEYSGEEALVPGRLRGIREPSGPRLGTAAAASADVVLVPALAVDRRGVRLGRGAGHYDRTLVPGTAELLAVVRTAELVRELPGESHDVPMSGALTPSGVVRFPAPAVM